MTEMRLAYNQDHLMVDMGERTVQAGIDFSLTFVPGHEAEAQKALDIMYRDTSRLLEGASE